LHEAGCFHPQKTGDDMAQQVVVAVASTSYSMQVRPPILIRMDDVETRDVNYFAQFHDVVAVGAAADVAIDV
jgi:hypothetical protein